MSLLQYIADFQSGEHGDTTLYVLGNQSADLDSVASSLVLAYALSQMAPPALKIYPIVNTGRTHFAPFCLAAVGKVQITTDLLYFIEDPIIKRDIWKVHPKHARKYLLVDHNGVDHLNRGWWERQVVVGVFDHHTEQPNELKQAYDRVYYNAGPYLGSTCTIITELLTKAPPPEFIRKLHRTPDGEVQPSTDAEDSDSDEEGKDPGNPQMLWLEGLIEMCGYTPAKTFEKVQLDDASCKLLAMAIQEDTADFHQDLYGDRWQDRDKEAYEVLLKKLRLEDGSTIREMRKDAKMKALAAATADSWSKLLHQDLKVYQDITPRPLPFSSLGFSLEFAGRSKELARTVLGHLEGHGVNEMCVLCRDGLDRCLWHFQLLGSPSELKQVLFKTLPRLVGGEPESHFARQLIRDCMDVGLVAQAHALESRCSRKVLEDHLRKAFFPKDDEDESEPESENSVASSSSEQSDQKST